MTMLIVVTRICFPCSSLYLLYMILFTGSQRSSIVFPSLFQHPYLLETILSSVPVCHASSQMLIAGHCRKVDQWRHRVPDAFQQDDFTLSDPDSKHEGSGLWLGCCVFFPSENPHVFLADFAQLFLSRSKRVVFNRKGMYFNPPGKSQSRFTMLWCPELWKECHPNITSS